MFPSLGYSLSCINELICIKLDLCYEKVSRLRTKVNSLDLVV